MKFIASPLVHTALSLLVLFGCSAAPVVTSLAPSEAGVSPEQMAALQLKLDEDENLLARLEQNPVATLKTEGIALPEGEQVKVLTVGESLYLILDDRNLTRFHPYLVSASAETPSEMQKQLDAIRAKAQTNAAFKSQLLTDTQAALQAEGLDAEIASLFEVVDYLPNTSLLLLSAEGAEVTRGNVADEIEEFFKEDLSSMSKAMVTILKLLVPSKMTGEDVLINASRLNNLSEIACKVIPPRQRSGKFVCEANLIYWTIKLNRLRDVHQKAVDGVKNFSAPLRKGIEDNIERIKSLRTDINQKINSLQAQLQKEVIETAKKKLQQELDILFKDKQKLEEQQKTLEEELKKLSDKS